MTALFSGGVSPQVATTPEGIIVAPVGTIVSADDKSVWMKNTGVGDTGWFKITGGAAGSVVYNPASIPAGSRVSTTVSVPGAVVGDGVRFLSFGADTQGVVLEGRVSAAGTVTVDFWNPTGAAIDLASSTLTVKTEPTTAPLMIGSAGSAISTSTTAIPNLAGGTASNVQAVLAEVSTELVERTRYIVNVADLRALVAADCYGKVDTLGYTTAGDGGGHGWYWDAASTATDNGGTIVKSVPATGRWLTTEPKFHLSHWGFLPGNTGAQNTTAYLSAYPSMAGKTIYFPPTECLVAETTPPVAATAYSALPLPSNATLVEPFVKLDANQNTFCRVFYTTATTATSRTDIIGGVIDGNYLNQPATEHHHAFFLNWCSNVRVFDTHAQNFNGDAFFTYNGVTDCGAYRMTSSNIQRNGATLDGGAHLEGDNLRTSIVDCTFEARVQPIDLEISGTIGATVSTIRDAYIAGNTCIVKTDTTMNSSTAIALATNQYKRGNGVCVNNRCVNGSIYGWFGADWIVENNTIVFGVELTATLNSTTAVTGLAVKGVPNGVPLVGYKVFGEGIPAGATFTAVNMAAGTATLSAAATVTGTVTIGSSLVQPDVGMEFRGGVSTRVRNNSITMACTPVQLRVVNVAHFASPYTEHEMTLFEGNTVYFPLKVAGMEVGFFSGNENIIHRNRWVVPAKDDINPIVRVWGIGNNNLSAEVTSNTILASGTGQGYGGIEVWKFSGNGFARNVTVKDNKISGCSVGVYTYAVAFGAAASWVQTGNEFTNCTTNELTSGTMPPNRIAGSEGGIATYVVTGTPEGVVTAPVGSTALRSDGGATTSLYVKTSGTGNTGWTGK